MFDKICSELRDVIHNAIRDLQEAADIDELAPEFSNIADDCDVITTDDGLMLICGEDMYSIALCKI